MCKLAVVSLGIAITFSVAAHASPPRGQIGPFQCGYFKTLPDDSVLRESMDLNLLSNGKTLWNGLAVNHRELLTHAADAAK